jgi:glyoxylase-like metal-dependent hydrolase (beta-lactamase superfamily II)
VCTVNVSSPQIGTERRHRAAAMQADVAGFFHTPSNTWSYVVSDPQTRRAAVIDSVLDYDPRSGRTSTVALNRIVAYLRRHDLTLDWILETHAHADHLSGAHVLHSTVGGLTGIGAGITQVQATFKRIFNLSSEFQSDGSQFDRLLHDGDELPLGALVGKVMATPGHTNDSMTFLFGNAAFVGDTVFMPDGGTARCDFPGGDAAQLYRSITHLYELPEDTHVYVCHDYPPTQRSPRSNASIAEHKLRNTHLTADTTESDFVRFRKARDATLELPELIVPAVQVNIRAGRLPDAESNGVAYLKVPLNLLGHHTVS